MLYFGGSRKKTRKEKTIYTVYMENVMITHTLIYICQHPTKKIMEMNLII